MSGSIERGKAVGSVGTPALYEHLELSPDGRRVAVDSRDPESQKLNLWLMDIATGTPTRFTFDPGEYDVPRWSPDGSRLTFPRLGDRKGIYEKLSNGVGGENQLLASPHDGLVIPDDWSPDGRFIVFMNLPPEARGNLWLLPLFGDRQAVQVPNTGQRSANGRFSPDGRWLAYESLEPASERLQVYVQPFPASGAKWQISGEGGMKPRWRRDGKELYFVAPDGALMAAPIMTEGNFHVGVPVPLVTLRYAGRLIAQYPYDVSADGQRILIIAPEAEAGITPVTVLLNWIGLPAK